MPPTPNHEYEQPNRGASDWHVPMNDNFGALDTDVEVRDTEANRSQYTPTAGAKFLATDTEAVYLGDGADWNRLASTGQRPTFQNRRVTELGAKVEAANASLPNDTTTTVAFDSVAFDDFGDYDAANDRFVLSNPGLYHVLADLSWDLSVSGPTEFIEAEFDPGVTARQLKYSPGGQFPDSHLAAHWRVTEADIPAFNELRVTARHKSGSGTAEIIGGHLSVVRLG